MLDYLLQSVVTPEEPSQTEDETHSMQVSTNKNKLTFDDLPFEIRQYIFGFCGCRESKTGSQRGQETQSLPASSYCSSTPTILILTTTLNVVRLGLIHLDSKNKRCLDGMRVTVMGMIKKLHITVEE